MYAVPLLGRIGRLSHRYCLFARRLFYCSYY